jgi:enamine deaminase RidA (YjgF/YER057c/UK114 family)
MSGREGIEVVNPTSWAAPRGYSNGMRVPAGRDLLFIAGQIAWDESQTMVGVASFAQQFEQALKNVVAVCKAAGGSPEDLVSMTIFVTDKRAYLSEIKEIGSAWRTLIGSHYPTMALVEVAALVEDDAMVEIQAVAALKAQESA